MVFSLLKSVRGTKAVCNLLNLISDSCLIGKPIIYLYTLYIFFTWHESTICVKKLNYNWQIRDKSVILTYTEVNISVYCLTFLFILLMYTFCPWALSKMHRKKCTCSRVFKRKKTFVSCKKKMLIIFVGIGQDLSLVDWCNKLLWVKKKKN